MTDVTEIAQNAIINLEEAVDSLSRRYRQRFGYGDSIRVVPYTGYGHGKHVRVSGRVLADRKVNGKEGANVARNLVGMLRRYKTDDVADARLRITVGDTTREVLTDEEGYYDEVVELKEPIAANGLVTEYEIELLAPRSRNEQLETKFTGGVQIPTNARFGIISDIDDTIVHTGAHDLLKHVRTVVLNNAHSRAPFAGVAAFYQALTSEQGIPTNPIFYVSSSPTNLYELFVDFMEATHIPKGTILLKDFGFEPGKFLKASHDSYKRERIEEILSEYPDMSFILIGDSGQRDAQIYRSIVNEHRDRILAVYIRDVTPRDEGSEDVYDIVRDVREMDVPMLLMNTTEIAAKHAADEGWITPSELARVREHVDNPDLETRKPGLVGHPR